MASKAKKSDPKSNAAAATGVPQQINALLSSLTEEERACNRAAFLHLMQSMVGTEVDIDYADGKKKIKGIFHTATPFPSRDFGVAVKAARVVKGGSTADEDRGSTLMIDFNSTVACIQASKLDLKLNMNSNEFQTDTSIKKTDISHLQGRNLESVDNSWLDPTTGTSLETEGGATDWDQFETNKRLFAVKSSYDENLYTKKLDMKSMTKEQIAAAGRLAREIEGQMSSNIHLQEERGQLQERDVDEETMYSGVVRDDKEMKDFSHSAASKVKAAVGGSHAGVTANAWSRGSKLPGQGSTSPVGGKQLSAQALNAVKEKASKNSSAGAVAGATKTGNSPPAAAAVAGQNSPKSPSAPPGMPPPKTKSSAAAPAAGPTPATAVTAKAVDKVEQAVCEAGAAKEGDAAAEKSPAAVEIAPVVAAAAVAAAAPAATAAEAKPASKLNAGAKEFKFNANCATFVPGGGAGGLPVPPKTVPSAAANSSPQQHHMQAMPPQPQAGVVPLQMGSAQAGAAPYGHIPQYSQDANGMPVVRYVPIPANVQMPPAGQPYGGMMMMQNGQPVAMGLNGQPATQPAAAAAPTTPVVAAAAAASPSPATDSESNPVRAAEGVESNPPAPSTPAPVAPATPQAHSSPASAGAGITASPQIMPMMMPLPVTGSPSMTGLPPQMMQMSPEMMQAFMQQQQMIMGMQQMPMMANGAYTMAYNPQMYGNQMGAGMLPPQMMGMMGGSPGMMPQGGYMGMPFMPQGGMSPQSPYSPGMGGGAGGSGYLPYGSYGANQGGYGGGYHSGGSGGFGPKSDRNYAQGNRNNMQGNGRNQGRNMGGRAGQGYNNNNNNSGNPSHHHGSGGSSHSHGGHTHSNSNKGAGGQGAGAAGAAAAATTASAPSAASKEASSASGAVGAPDTSTA